MRVAKTNQEEISRLNSLLCEIEWLSKDFRSGHDYESIDWSEYEILSTMVTDYGVEAFLETLCHKIAGNHFGRIFMNLSTLLDNCAHPGLTHLDFNPQIKAGFEALELLLEIDDFCGANDIPPKFVETFNEKIQDILSKVPENKEA